MAFQKPIPDDAVRAERAEIGMRQPIADPSGRVSILIVSESSVPVAECTVLGLPHRDRWYSLKDVENVGKTDAKGRLILALAELSGFTGIGLSAPGFVFCHADVPDRSGPVTYVMKRGGRLRLRVQDYKGERVPRGRVFASRSALRPSLLMSSEPATETHYPGPSVDGAIYEATYQEDGGYLIGPVPPGDYTIVVNIPGHAVQSGMVGQDSMSDWDVIIPGPEVSMTVVPVFAVAVLASEKTGVLGWTFESQVAAKLVAGTLTAAGLDREARRLRTALPDATVIAQAQIPERVGAQSVSWSVFALVDRVGWIGTQVEAVRSDVLRASTPIAVPASGSSGSGVLKVSVFDSRGVLVKCGGVEVRAQDEKRHIIQFFMRSGDQKNVPPGEYSIRSPNGLAGRRTALVSDGQHTEAQFHLRGDYCERDVAVQLPSGELAPYCILAFRPETGGRKSVMRSGGGEPIACLLPRGKYEMTVRVAGFQPATQNVTFDSATLDDNITIKVSQ